MDNKWLVNHLYLLIAELGSQKAVAKKLKISQQYLNDILRGRREPGDKILKPLGLKKVISYEYR